MQKHLNLRNCQTAFSNGFSFLFILTLKIFFFQAATLKGSKHLVLTFQKFCGTVSETVHQLTRCLDGQKNS